ncbi:hypothetical protein FACS189494_04360 [Spirochaetia bacterium]|nr:hypothetical protein FACS189494_04360 [Spirochaetia bacterium]
MIAAFLGINYENVMYNTTALGVPIDLVGEIKDKVGEIITPYEKALIEQVVTSPPPPVEDGASQYLYSQNLTLSCEIAKVRSELNTLKCSRTVRIAMRVRNILIPPGSSRRAFVRLFKYPVKFILKMLHINTTPFLKEN